MLHMQKMKYLRILLLHKLGLLHNSINLLLTSWNSCFVDHGPMLPLLFRDHQVLHDDPKASMHVVDLLVATVQCYLATMQVANCDH